jgi:hypothetical protein
LKDDNGSSPTVLTDYVATRWYVHNGQIRVERNPKKNYDNFGGAIVNCVSN